MPNIVWLINLPQHLLSQICYIQKLSFVYLSKGAEKGCRRPVDDPAARRGHGANHSACLALPVTGNRCRGFGFEPCISRQTLLRVHGLSSFL